MLTPEPPDKTRLEFECGTDVYAAWRDDEASRIAGWPSGGGGRVWCLYGHTVPVTWAKLNEEYDNTPAECGVRLLVHPDDAAIREQWPTQVLWREKPEEVLASCRPRRRAVSGDRPERTQQ